MGLLNKIRRQAPAPATEDRTRMVSNAPQISFEQERMNRELMESEMEESRRKRESGQ